MAHKHQELCDQCGENVVPEGENSHGWRGIRLTNERGNGGKFVNKRHTMPDVGSIYDSPEIEAHAIIQIGEMSVVNQTGSARSDFNLPGIVCGWPCFSAWMNIQMGRLYGAYAQAIVKGVS